jgi:hypothetical protein
MTTTAAVATEIKKALKVGPTTLAEEKAAAEAEKPRPTANVTPTIFKRINRVHELKAKKDEIEAEIELHKGFVYKLMNLKGVDVLVKRGVEVASRDPFTTVTCNWKQLEKDYPEIAAQYITKTKSKRVNWKKPFGGILGK